jgi:hypothetical protein
MLLLSNVSVCALSEFSESEVESVWLSWSMSEVVGELLLMNVIELGLGDDCFSRLVSVLSEEEGVVTSLDWDLIAFLVLIGEKRLGFLSLEFDEVVVKFHSRILTLQTVNLKLVSARKNRCCTSIAQYFGCGKKMLTFGDLFF